VGDARMVWRPDASLIIEHNPKVQASMHALAAMAVQRMKYHCPVSPVYPTYAAPVPVGSSRGRAYQARGKGLARPGGEPVALRRLAGDLPLRPSGYLRNSIVAQPGPGDTIIVGPTADYGGYVNNGTRPHIIRSHGPWPLRSRATGQVFGPVVHHPGTRAQRYVEAAARDLDGVTFR
jgi:hypothetical protein